MHGDLNIRLQIHVPEKLTRTEKELYQQLRETSARSKKHLWQ